MVRTRPLLGLVIAAIVAAALASTAVLAQVQKVPPPAPAPAKTVAKIEVQAIAPAQVQVQVRKGVMMGAMNVDPMIQQFTQQGRPLVRAEILFVRKVCQPTVDQLRAINREATTVLKEVVTQMAEDRGRMMVRQVGQARTVHAHQGDANKLLRDGLAAAVKKNLTAQQWTLYQAEVEKRTEGQKKSAVHYLVNTLDRELCLSDEQRALIAESLAAHWDDSWTFCLDYLLFGNQFFPAGIESYVSRPLNDHQKKVWQGAQRMGGFWAFGSPMNSFGQDGDNLEEELGEPVGGPNAQQGPVILHDVMIRHPNPVPAKKALAPAIEKK